MSLSGRSTSLHLKAIATSILDNLEQITKHQAQIEQSHNQQSVRFDEFLRETASAIVRHQRLLAERANKELSDIASNEDVSLDARLGRQTNHAVAEKMRSWQLASRDCNCCCHQRHSDRSPRFVDGIIGTFFAGYYGIPYLAPRCTMHSCAQTCLVSDFLLTVTYFFPTWFLSWAVTLAFKKSYSGFDYSFRVANCVKNSSPIFQCAYQGDVAGIKVLLRSNLGSPFDITPKPERSLLGVCTHSFIHVFANIPLKKVAASRGHGEICDILIHAGADPFFVDYKNRCVGT